MSAGQVIAATYEFNDKDTAFVGGIAVTTKLDRINYQPKQSSVNEAVVRYRFVQNDIFGLSCSYDVVRHIAVRKYDPKEFGEAIKIIRNSLVLELENLRLRSMNNILNGLSTASMEAMVPIMKIGIDKMSFCTLTNYVNRTLRTEVVEPDISDLQTHLKALLNLWHQSKATLSHYERTALCDLAHDSFYRTKVLALDIEGVLTDIPLYIDNRYDSMMDRYSSLKLDYPTMELVVNRIKHEGYEAVVLYTARQLKYYDSVATTVKSFKEVLKKQEAYVPVLLSQSKPHFTILIDDKAVNKC